MESRSRQLERYVTSDGKIIGVKKMGKSISYNEHLMEFLSNPKAAAAYLEEILEGNDNEPELLPLALGDVAEALGKSNLSSEEFELHQDKLNNLLSKQEVKAIYHLAQLLKLLGLKLTVSVQQPSQENLSNPSVSYGLEIDKKIIDIF